jgi:uncharacterized protein YciI
VQRETQEHRTREPRRLRWCRRRGRLGLTVFKGAGSAVDITGDELITLLVMEGVRNRDPEELSRAQKSVGEVTNIRLNRGEK